MKESALTSWNVLMVINTVVDPLEKGKSNWKKESNYVINHS
jgi:hypothetical protein